MTSRSGGREDAPGHYVLYGGGVTRAVVAEMVMAEGDIAYELRPIDILAEEHRRTDFLELNPAGYLPALVTPEGDVLHELAAILVYLCERHRLEDLMPLPGDPLRGLFLSKLFFHTNDIQPPTKRFFYAHRYAAEPSQIPAVKENARAQALERWGVLDRYLAVSGPYHLGQRFSLLDLHVSLWASYGLSTREEILETFPRVRWIYDQVSRRPKSGPLLRGLKGELER